jgi:hypothetical protein
VKVNRVPFREWLENACEADLQSVVRGRECQTLFPGRPWAALVEDFRITMAEARDRLAEVGALRLLALDHEEFETSAAPHVIESLCSAEILTRVDTPAFPMDASPLTPAETVRRLWLAWLEQMALGRTLLVNSFDDELGVRADGTIEFAGGRFTTLPSETRESLLGYLDALTTGDAATAVAFLEREMDMSGAAKGVAEEFARAHLQDQFQLTDDGALEGLFRGWRLLAEGGAVASSHLLRFQQGFFRIAEVCFRLSSGMDEFRNSLERIGIRANLVRLRRMVEPERLMDLLEDYTFLLASAPAHLDSALSLEALMTSQEHRDRPSTTGAGDVSGTLLLLLCSLILWLDYLGNRYHWTEAASVGALVIIGTAALLSGRHW